MRNGPKSTGPCCSTTKRRYEQGKIHTPTSSPFVLLFYCEPFQCWLVLHHVTFSLQVQDLKALLQQNNRHFEEGPREGEAAHNMLCKKLKSKTLKDEDGKWVNTLNMIFKRYLWSHSLCEKTWLIIIDTFTDRRRWRHIWASESREGSRRAAGPEQHPDPESAAPAWGDQSAQQGETSRRELSVTNCSQTFNNEL